MKMFFKKKKVSNSANNLPSDAIKVEYNVEDMRNLFFQSLTIFAKSSVKRL